MSQPESPPFGRVQVLRSDRCKRAVLSLLVPALTLFAGIAFPAGAQAATNGTITGTFTVPAGTASPSDVQVRLADRNGAPASISVGDETVIATGTTSGSYTIANVVPGQYYVYLADTAATDNVAPDYYGDAGTDNITKATVVTVPATGGTQSLTAQALASGAVITGAVTDANLSSETTTSVTAVPASAAASVTDPLQVDAAAPVAAGTYRIGNLPAGDYRLRYHARGAIFALSNVYVGGGSLTYDFGSGTQYPVTSGTVKTANFAVPAVGAITGTVTDAADAALDGVNVTVFDLAGNQISSAATTAVDGTYTVADILPGTYEVEFNGLAGSSLASVFYGGATLATATKVTVATGATTGSVDASLGAGATVSGTVTAAQGGAPLGGLAVWLLDAQGNVVDLSTTNADGSYTITNVPAGTWYVEFVGGLAYNGRYYATEYYLGQPGLAGAKPIKVGAGQKLSGINEALLGESATAPGLPRLSLGRLSGLSTNKVALSFKLAAGTGPAAYLQSFSIKLPKHISWNRAALGHDIVIARDKYTYAIRSGRLLITFATGKKTVNFAIKAGGVKLSRAIQTQAQRGGIASEAIALTVTDTSGKSSSTSYTVKKPR